MINSGCSNFTSVNKMVTSERSSCGNTQQHRLSLSDDNISDYELVTNDGDMDDDDDDDSDGTRTHSGYRKITNAFSVEQTNHEAVTLGKLNFDQIKAIDDKLRLCLTSEKIALNRRQTVDGDGRESLVSRQRNHRVPSFTIVPINLSRNDNYPMAESESDKKNLPEIVLTSFDPSAARRDRRRSITPPKKLDVTQIAEVVNVQPSIFQQQQQKYSTPSTVFHYAACDHDDDDFVEPGNSPSPESFVDNQLSAASSVSVHSCCSGATGDSSFEMAQLSDCSMNSNSVLDEFNEYPRRESQTSQSVLMPMPMQQQPKEINKHPVPIKGAALMPSSRPQTDNQLKPSQTTTVTTTSSTVINEFPAELTCSICQNVFKDPRTLNCLHSFCFQCLVDENFKKDSSIPFWSQPDQSKGYDWKSSNSGKSQAESSPDNSLVNGGGSSSAATTPVQRRGSRTSFASFRRKKSIDKLLSRPKSAEASPQRNSEKQLQIINCKRCNFATEVPVGGIRQLPQNFIVMRKIDRIRMKIDDELISALWCSLCSVESSATYHCMTCVLNLCSFCKEAHERQRSTSNHKIKYIVELRKSRKLKKTLFDDSLKITVNCPVHPGYEIKSFCCSCLQVTCSDCIVLQHKGHRHESIAKAFAGHKKYLRESTEQTRFLPEYAEHSIGRLDDIAKTIASKCDNIQAEVENFMRSYVDAVELHRQTLLQQIHRAREAKIEMILEQKLDMEKRSKEALEAVQFSQELIESGSQTEILSFINILLRRFEYCQKFRAPVDVKICDSLQFLPQIRAPSNKKQNHIPLFGIITTQTVEPTLCSLETEGFTQLRLHRKIECLVVTRDADGAPMCHGGLTVNVHLKYKENPGKRLPFEVNDRRDGTYTISFVPDSQGTLSLTVTINEKQIKGSPYIFPVRTVRPHNGIYHCCTFCSSKGSKVVKCSCEGRMPGYDGCGHGHEGHPGRRHWSCCGNVLENSECTTTNKMLSS